MTHLDLGDCGGDKCGGDDGGGGGGSSGGAVGVATRATVQRIHESLVVTFDCVCGVGEWCG